MKMGNNLQNRINALIVKLEGVYRVGQYSWIPQNINGN